MHGVGNRDNGRREGKINSDGGAGYNIFQRAPPDTMDRRLTYIWMRHATLFFIILAVIG